MSVIDKYERCKNCGGSLFNIRSGWVHTRDMGKWKPESTCIGPKPADGVAIVAKERKP